MADKKPGVYMDAHAILDTLKLNLFPSAEKIPGAPKEKQPYFIDNLPAKRVHLEYCGKLFKAARNDKIDLFTSTLTLAEAWHLGIKPPSDEDKRILDSVLTSGRIFKLIPDSYFIGRNARDLVWSGIELTGADAIHVASALEAECDEIITNDSAIHAAAERLKARGLLVITAEKTASLPDSYHTPLLDMPEGAKAASVIGQVVPLVTPDYTDRDDEEVTHAAKSLLDQIIEETESDE